MSELIDVSFTCPVDFLIQTNRFKVIIKRRRWFFIDIWQLKVIEKRWNFTTDAKNKNTLSQFLSSFVFCELSHRSLSRCRTQWMSFVVAQLVVQSWKHWRGDFFFRGFFSLSLFHARAYLHFHYLHESINSMLEEEITQLVFAFKA